MTPADIRAVVASARLRPRMYGPSPQHLAGYLHGMIAGAAPSGADVNVAWCEALACADPRAMTDDEACDAADATVAALWPAGGDAADEVQRLRAQLAATEAEARTALNALHARCDAAEAETAAAETLAGKLGDLLRATADALKGPPPPLSTHSTHDLPEVAAEMRRRDEYSTAIVGLHDSMKEEHVERARDLGRFRGQACYTASVARRLLPSLETHGADGWPLDRVAADALAAEVERLRAELAVTEAEAQRLRAARLDDAARHATECVRWGDRKVELLGRIVGLEAALKAAQPALVLDAVRRGPAVMCCTHCSAEWPLDDAHCPGCGHPDREGGAAPRPKARPDIWCHACGGVRFGDDGYRCPTCRGTGRHPPPEADAPPEPDLFAGFGDIFEGAAVDDAPDEAPQPNADRAQLAALAGARFAEQHPHAAGAIMGGVAHREDVTNGSK